MPQRKAPQRIGQHREWLDTRRYLSFLHFLLLPIIIMGMVSSPTPFRLNDQSLRRLISDAAGDTSRVFFTAHSKQRMKERKISPTQVYDCLRNGLVTEPAHTNIHGHSQCTLTRRNAGDEVRVAVALERAENGGWVVVLTVF
jgi:hypothetical protein